jgi:hypothetical protein
VDFTFNAVLINVKLTEFSFPAQLPQPVVSLTAGWKMTLISGNVRDLLFMTTLRIALWKLASIQSTASFKKPSELVYYIEISNLTSFYTRFPSK